MSKPRFENRWFGDQQETKTQYIMVIRSNNNGTRDWVGPYDTPEQCIERVATMPYWKAIGDPVARKMVKNGDAWDFA